MNLSTEYKMQKLLMIELRGLLHNLKYNTEEYCMAQKILQEIRRTENGVIKIMCKYADFLAKNGIFVRELLEDII